MFFYRRLLFILPFFADMMELKEIAFDLANKINQKNTQLVKCLRNRERHRIKESKHCDMVTAILQAWSSKTRKQLMRQYHRILDLKQTAFNKVVFVRM